MHSNITDVCNWQKFELIVFCKENQLLTKGSKLELTNRIKNFLSNNELKNEKDYYHLKTKRRIIKKIN
ncbi:hypothetical protein [Lacinutrix himadriensis]|uniref:hypothetical protein n=1 Tax=Lacinutrix himadriensis TaxID=641549 RepID=UPI0006E34869